MLLLLRMQTCAQSCRQVELTQTWAACAGRLNKARSEDEAADTASEAAAWAYTALHYDSARPVYTSQCANSGTSGGESRCECWK